MMGQEVWVPIVAMVLSIGGPVVLVIIILMNRHRLAQQKYLSIHDALESGKTPEEVEQMIDVMEKQRVKSPKRRTGYLRAGFVLMGASISTLFIGLIIGVTECLAAAAGGFALGLALTAVWLVVDRSPDRA
jgi:hypothetical protein